jgi:hypothetical protein
LYLFTAGLLKGETNEDREEKIMARFTFWLKHFLLFLGVAGVIGGVEHLITPPEFIEHLDSVAVTSLGYSLLIYFLLISYSVIEGAWGAKSKNEGLKESRQTSVRVLLFLIEMAILITFSGKTISFFTDLMIEIASAVFVMRFFIYFGLAWFLSQKIKRSWLVIIMGVPLAVFLEILIYISFTLMLKDASGEIGSLAVSLIGFAGMLFTLLASRGVKYLVWKELRETWIAFAIVITVPVLIALFLGADTVYIISVSFLGFLFAGFLGGRSFASETENQTLDYLSTRPLHPRTLFLVKYLTGYGLSMIMLSIYIGISLLFGEHSSFDIKYDVAFGFFPAFVLTFFYSISLVFSFMTKDTLRSSLLGFGGCSIISSLLAITSYLFPDAELYLKKDLMIVGVYLYKSFFYYLAFFIFILGTAGVTYFSWLKKRLEWKNGFMAMIPASLVFLALFNANYFGAMRPDSLYTVNTSLTNNCWNQRIYDASSNLTTTTVMYMDTADANKYKITTMRPKIEAGFVEFDKNYLYGLKRVVGKAEGEIIKYDLSQDSTVQEVKRVALPHVPATALSLKTAAGSVHLYNKNRELYAFLSLPERELYYGSNGRQIMEDKPVKYLYKQFEYKKWCAVYDKETLALKEFLAMDSTMNIFPWIYGISYHQYAFGVEDERHYTWLNLYDASDWKHPRFLKRITKLGSMDLAWMLNQEMVIQGNYLYASLDKKALRVYDLRTLPELKEVSSVAYGFADRVAEYNEPFMSWRHLIVNSSDAIIINKRGVLRIDISNPAKPKIVGRDATFNPSDEVSCIGKKLYMMEKYSDGRVKSMRIYDFGRRKN